MKMRLSFRCLGINKKDRINNAEVNADGTEREGMEVERGVTV